LNVIIRRVQRANIVDLISLMEEHADYERAYFNVDNLATKLIDAIESEPPKAMAYVAQIENQSVGYCALTREFSSWQASEYLHMDCLYIKDEMRGLKIGRMLFDQALDHAKKMGVTELQWQTPEWNNGAIRFYRGLGARDSLKRRFTFSLG